MKMQHVPVEDIVWNPWRDEDLYPIDKKHVTELVGSIHSHGFFGGIKGRRHNGKVEIGCGHARIEAARKHGETTVPIFVGEMDEDQMLRLMTDENATQGGANPGAVMNEVAAVTRRIIEELLSAQICALSVVRAFENERGVERARTSLRMRLTEPEKADVHLVIGYRVIARYLGQGNEKKSLRGEHQILEAITALKQSGRYENMVDDLVRKYPLSPEKLAKLPKSRAKDIATTKSSKKPRRRILDEKCANLFPNDHQFRAFREAITTPAAQQVIAVDKQYEIAEQIMSEDTRKEFSQKHVGAPFIKKMVQHHVQKGMGAQRTINKEEQEAYMREQREERIAHELHSANASLRSLGSAIARLQDLAKEFPHHPKIIGFADRLHLLAQGIQRFNERLNPKKYKAS